MVLRQVQKLIWKKKVSKSNVLLFQLQASVRGIKEKGKKGLDYCQLISDHLPQSIGKHRELEKKRSKEKKETRNKSYTLHFVDHVQMYPTPTQDSASERTKKYKQGGTPLPLAVRMFPTPTVGCEEGESNQREWSKQNLGGFILRKTNQT